MINKRRIGNIANGFILADVMLGMLILVIALLAIGTLYLQSHKVTMFSDNQTIAYNWAQERMEYLKSTSSWRGSSAAGTTPSKPADAGNAAPPRPGFTRDMTIVYPATIAALPTVTGSSKNKLLAAVNNRLIDTTVTVSWTENGAIKSVSLETLIEYE